MNSDHSVNGSELIGRWSDSCLCSRLADPLPAHLTLNPREESVAYLNRGVQCALHYLREVSLAATRLSFMRLSSIEACDPLPLLPWLGFQACSS